MSNFNVPYEFIGGTKAKAEHMNENFSAICNAINSKPDINSNGTVDVGIATESTHAVNKGQVENIINSALTSKVELNLSNLNIEGQKKLQYVAYSYNEGNIKSDGESDLLDIADNTKVVFNIDNDNPLIGSLADGTKFTRTSIPDFDCSNLADGIYNIFVGMSGNCLLLSNTIYRQKKQPDIPVESQITQPKLSSNNTLGGDNFAVQISSVNNSDTPAWKAFDKDNSTHMAFSGGNTGTLIIYSPVSIKLTKLWHTNVASISSSRTTLSGAIYGSNDNSNWTLLNSYTNSNQTSNARWAINVNSTNFYKYYKMTFNKTSGGSYAIYCAEIDLEAVTINSLLNTNDVWLDTSIKPYKSYKYNGTDFEEFNYVSLPQTIKIENGFITEINKSGNYNQNGYDEFVNLPDINKVTSLTNGTLYTASANGWIFNGTALVRPLFIGESFTPNTGDYKFYMMKGV